MLAGAEQADAPIDARVDALTDERRRRTVRHTVDTEGPIEFDELVEYLDGAASDSAPSATDPDAIALRLYHVDLPKLADVGLVDYDRETKRVEATDAAVEHRPLLDGLDE